MNTWSKTLFVSAGARVALLVTNINGKHSQKAKRFSDAHAALAWCENNGAMMVFTPALNAVN